MPAPGNVVLQSYEPPLVVEVMLDEQAPVITGGYANWDETQRPRRVSLTDYSGRSPFRQSLALLFDGFADGVSVQADVSRLEQMALPRSPSGDDPPALVLYGPVHHADLTWVIDGLDWGDSVRDDSTGALTRQAAVVHLLEHVVDERAGHTVHKRKRARTYVVRQGDTLQKIAARLLGKASRWREIAKLNGIRDPKSIRPGQVLLIP